MQPFALSYWFGGLVLVERIRSMRISLRFIIFYAAVFGLLAGCATQNNQIIGPTSKRSNVDRQLPVGAWGLRKLSPGQYPNMQAAFMDKKGLITAINRSLKFMAAPSSREFYPDGPITHRQVVSSLLDFKWMLRNVTSASQFQQMIDTRYDVYIAKGYNVRSDVWFTGYYTPILYGSLTETGRYRYPVYKKPRNLAINPITGQILGEKMPNGSYAPYPTRRQIVQGHLLAGRELVWFANPLDAYVAEIQGSAKIILTDGQVMTIGYAGDNGRTYTGLGMMLVKQKVISRRQLSLSAIESYFQIHPHRVEADILKNHFMAFLKVYNPAHWPLGSLGVKVTAHRTLATDKTITAPPYQSIFPRAALTFVTTQMPNTQGQISPYSGFLLDQDTGGAIRAAGRADIYMGVGPEAQTQAGYEFARGHLYYLFLKPGVAPHGAGGMPTAVQTTSMPVTGGAPYGGASTSGGSESMQQMFPGAK
jgi:membrane-bound lytic murein transglycosylase A